MSESEHPPLDDPAHGTRPIGSTEPAPAAPLPPAANGSPELHALLELIGRGLALDADDGMRAQARELWTRCAAELLGATHVGQAVPAAPVPAAIAMPLAPPLLHAPAQAPPMAPITAAVQTLKQMTPDQLLDTLLQRLRAALPTGAQLPPPPRGIQFHLVPAQPPGGGVK